MATLTVNRPAALDALNREVLQEMARVIREVRHDSSVRVLIVTGAGNKAFVAGAEYGAMAKMSAVDGLDFWRLRSSRDGKLRGPRRFPSSRRSTVLRSAAAWSFALACDLIIASDKARFGEPRMDLDSFRASGERAAPAASNRARQARRTDHDRRHVRRQETALELGLANQVVSPANSSRRRASWPRIARANRPLRWLRRRKPPWRGPHLQWKKMPACASNRRRWE